MAAVFPVASNVPTHSGSYAPELYAKKTLLKFYQNTCLTEIANTDYQGEISKVGDTVNIRLIPDIAINDYVIGGGIVTTRPAATKTQLLINKGKQYSFPINSVQELQSDISLNSTYTYDAGNQMKRAVEIDCFSNIYADAHTYNKGTTAGIISRNIDLGTTLAWETVTKVNVTQYLVDMGTVLTEQKVPDDGKRWLILPPSMTAQMKLSDLKAAFLTGDAKSPLVTGKLSDNYNGFRLYENINLARVLDGTTYVYHCMAGHTAGLTFAAQMNVNRVIDDPNDFGKLVQGLMIYGYKVTKPDCLIDFYATV